MKKLDCQAVAKRTQKQCSKKAHLGTNYCWIHYPKKGPVIFLFIGALLSILLQIAYDSTTVSDEEEKIIELSEKLRPFEELAKQFYPDIQRQDALKNLKNNIIDLRKQLEPRNLSKLQIKSITDKIKRFNNVNVMFRTIPHPEAAVFAEQLMEALESGGWQVKENKISPLSSFSGIGLSASEVKSNEPLLALYLSLKDIGYDPKLGRNDSFENKVIGILIGAKKR